MHALNTSPRRSLWRCLTVLMAIVLGSYDGTGVRAAPGAATQQASGPFAIILGSATPHRYTVSLVDLHGRVVAQTGAQGTQPIYTGGNGGGAVSVSLPPVSASNTRVYYLDGDALVRYLKPNSSTGIAARLPGSPTSRIAFAVSPDDGRIAFSVLQYPPDPVHKHDYGGMRLYVEDLPSGRSRRKIFAAQAAEWPIGWHQGALVLAVGYPFTQNFAQDPYSAWLGYHVADASTAQHLATLCAGGQGLGVVGPAGTICYDYPNRQACRGWRSELNYVQDWTGACRHFALSRNMRADALAPDGIHLAITEGNAPTSSYILQLNGQRTKLAVAATTVGTPVGWLDDTHLVFGPGFDGNGPLSILDLHSGAIAGTTAVGRFVGVLPGAL